MVTVEPVVRTMVRTQGFIREEFARFLDAHDPAPMAIPELVDLFSRPSRVPHG